MCCCQVSVIGRGWGGEVEIHMNVLNGAMLFVSVYVVSVNVSHDVAMYDVFHDFGTDGGHGYGSIVARGGLVAFLTYGGDVCG